MSHVEKQICSKQARPTKKRVLSVFIRTRLLIDTHTCFFWTDLKTLFIPVWTHLRRSWVSRSPGVPLSLSCQFSLHLSNKDKNIFKKRTESLDAASHLIVFLYFHKYLHCSRHHNVELNQKVWKHVLYVRFFEALLSRSCPSTETETRGKSDISLKWVCVRLIQQ